MLPFLSDFYAIVYAPTRFCPGTSHYMDGSARLKWVDPIRKNEPARQVSQPGFNPPHIIEISAPTQLASYDQAISFPIICPDFVLTDAATIFGGISVLGVTTAFCNVVLVGSMIFT